MATVLTPTDERPAAVPATITREGERFALAQRQARMFAMSPLVPDHLRKGPPEQAIANCWIALNLAEAMGEMPLIVMQNIHIINGKAGFASKYMIARANASGKFKDDIDWKVSGKGKELSATCFATLAKSGKRVEMTADMAMAEAEGWTRNSKYKTMPEVMLRYRSASFLVNMYAPEVMLGYRTAEEIEDIAAAAVEIAEPLTSKMLIDQSRTVETIDNETGKIIETVEERPDDAEPGEQLADDDDQADEGSIADDFSDLSAESDEGGGRTLAERIGLDDHPGKAVADAIIAEINAPECNAILDVATILNRRSLDMQSMLDEDAVRVEIAADKRRQAIRAEQSAGAK